MEKLDFLFIRYKIIYMKTSDGKKKRVVLTYGTFDMFHIGHLNILRRAKELGDYLIVGVSTDEFNALKGKKAFMPYEHRKQIVESIRYVDKVIPEKTWEQKVEDIKKYGVDVFVMGDDWKGKFDYLKKYCEVVYLPRTPGICSSDLRETAAYNQGYEDGYEDAKKEIIQKLKEKMKLSEEEIANILEISKEKVKAALEK